MAALLLALLLGACGVAPGPAAGEVSLPGDDAVLPTRRVNDYFLVDAWIDGSGPYPLLLDTGSDYIILDRCLRGVVGPLHRPAVSRIRSATGDVADVEDGATVAELTLGSITLRQVPVLFGDVSALGATIDTPVFGLLGIGPFEGMALELDYPNSAVTLHRAYDLDLEPGCILPSGDGSTPMLTVFIGGHQMCCLVDSGCGWAAAIPQHLGDELFVPGSDFVRDSVSLTGRHSRREGRLRHSVQVGPFDLRRVRAVAGNGSPKLGAPLLRRFRVVIDGKGRRVGLFPDPNPEPDPRRRWRHR